MSSSRSRDRAFGPGGWIFLVEPELHFDADVLVPDVAGWRRERMPEVPDVPWSDLAPDWVCEVLSPSTDRIDRKQKLAIYHRVGVGHVWFVDPEAQTLEVLRGADDAKWSLLAVHAGEEEPRAEPFEAMAFPLRRLWK